MGKRSVDMFMYASSLPVDLEKKDLNSLVRILNMCATGAVFEPPSEKAVLGKHVFDSTLEYGR